MSDNEYGEGILSSALRKLASGQLAVEEEMIRREELFDEMIFRRYAYDPTFVMFPNNTKH